MRVLMFGPSHSPHTIRPLKWLLENGIEVAFCDFQNPFPEGRKGYYYMPYPGYNDSVTIPYLKEVFEIFKPDIVHVHWLDRRAYQCVQAGLRPLVLSPWGSDINLHLRPDDHYSELVQNGTILSREILREVLLESDLLIYDEEKFKFNCFEIAGKTINSEYIHLGVDTYKFKPGYHKESNEFKKKYHIGKGLKVFTSFRRFADSYNQDKILESFSRALIETKKEAILIFKMPNKQNIFNNLDYMLEIKRRAIELGVCKYLRWIEEVSYSNLHLLYSISDYIINYPKIDTFPVTFLEAASSCKQVITCNLDSYQNTIIEKYFMFFDSDNPDSLSEQIIKAINIENTEMEKLYELRKDVIRNFDEKLYIKKLLKVYMTLSERKK